METYDIILISVISIVVLGLVICLIILTVKKEDLEIITSSKTRIPIQGECGKNPALLIWANNLCKGLDAVGGGTVIDTDAKANINDCKCECSVGFHDENGKCVKGFKNQCQDAGLRTWATNMCKGLPPGGGNNPTDPYAFSDSDCKCHCSSGYHNTNKDDLTTKCIKDCPGDDNPCHVNQGAGYCGTNGKCVCETGYHGGDDCGYMSFNILTYNVQLYGGWPAPDTAAEIRAKKIVEEVVKINNGNIDVFSFDETWTDEVRKILIDGLKAKGWGYHTKKLYESGCRGVSLDGWHTADCILNDGAILIISKHEIVADNSRIFKQCESSDCLASKGVLYCRVIKNSPKYGKKAFSIFAAHTQATQTSWAVELRKKQFQTMINFMYQHNIHESEPVFYCGDFNVGSLPGTVRHPGEYEGMLKILNAKEPQRIGNILYTSDPTTNSFVGIDGDATDPYGDGSDYSKTNGCFVKYFCSICNSSPKNNNPGEGCHNWCKDNDPDQYLTSKTATCNCCSSKWLDYILYSKTHEKPLHSSVEAIAIKVPSYDITVSGLDFKYKYPWLRTTDLSDHYPVLGRFRFPTPTNSPHIPDGCKFDSDCSYGTSVNGSCWCDGSNCTKDGKHVDGWKGDYGAESSVNKNCTYTGDGCRCTYNSNSSDYNYGYTDKK